MQDLSQHILSLFDMARFNIYLYRRVDCKPTLPSNSALSDRQKQEDLLKSQILNRAVAQYFQNIKTGIR